MKRGPTERPPTARMAGAPFATAIIPVAMRPLALVAVGVALLLVLGRAQVLRAGDQSEGAMIREIRITGNSSVKDETIRAKLISRVERPFNKRTMDNDIRTLNDTKLFTHVSCDVSRLSDGKGVILTFRVEESPTLTNVEFRGAKAIRLKQLEETTSFKKGARANPVRARTAVRDIKNLYEDKGYERAEVRLVKGGHPEDREVIFEIFEGPRFRTGKKDYIGNTFVSDAVLDTKVASREPLFGLIHAAGHYEKDGFDKDALALEEYYRQHGYLMVVVRPVVRSGSDMGERNVTFVISEGTRYKIRNLVFEGNRVVPSDVLKTDLKLKGGAFYEDALQKADTMNLMKRYFALGHVYADVKISPVPTDQPNVVDIKYHIDEGDEYTLGQIIVVGNHRTKDKVVRREADMAGLMPGERLDKTRLEKFAMRLQGTGYFQANPQMGKTVDVQIVNPRPKEQPFGDTAIPDLSGPSRSRMQNPDDPPAQPPVDAPPPMNMPAPSATPGGGTSPLAPFGGTIPGREFRPDPDTIPQIDVPSAPPGVPGVVPIPGGRPIDPKAGRQPPGPAGSLYDPTNPSGISPGFMNNNINPNIGPDRQEPFTANRAYADVMAAVEEGPTARFQLGIGASSFGGLYGQVGVTENNFNILAFPRSWDDIVQQRAFRGAGQQLSVELMPGTLVNVYSVSFRDPYLFDLPVGLGVSGYQFSRYYTDWHEVRSGGRFNLGKQFGTQAYGDVAFRIEDVNITGFKYPAPALLLDAAGHTTLATFRPSFRIDSRDSPFLPTSGTFAEVAFEQAVGTYNFSKFTAEARQYFTTGSRPDGQGKRVLTLRSFFGVTSRDTPIYERFFAGNLNSIRGFAFRGVGPYVLSVNTGGVFESLVSAEYRIPLTANEHFHQVFFIDTGTVENDYRISDYRVSIGTGLRVLIPQIFKQIPLALDLAFPLNKGPQDRVQSFNFSIGAMW
jgi:outer membrane protein insertion porin family